MVGGWALVRMPVYVLGFIPIGKKCVFFDDFKLTFFSSPWDGIGDHESLGDFV